MVSLPKSPSCVFTLAHIISVLLNDNNCRFSYKNIQKHSESKFNKGTVISTHHGHHFNGNFGLLITSLNCSFLQGGMIAQQTSLMGTQLIRTGSKVYLHLHFYLANCPIASCSSIRRFCTSTSIILSQLIIMVLKLWVYTH